MIALPKLTRSHGGILVPRTDEQPSRMGGYEFALDKGKGLWLPPSPAFWSMFDMPQWPVLAWNGGVNTPTAPPPAPETASPLWENPETVTEEIIAWRAWDYDLAVGVDGRAVVTLKSITMASQWDGPTLTAHEVPAANNNGGIHAIGLESHHEGNFERYIAFSKIWGTVALSGTVVEGRMGYRAERATVRELFVNPWDDDDPRDSPEGLCKLLAERYQCDCTIREPNWADIRTFGADPKVS